MTIWQGMMPGMTAGKVVNNPEPPTSIETINESEYEPIATVVRAAKPHELYTAAIGK